MKRYIIAFELTQASKSNSQKQQVKTFGEDKLDLVTSQVSSILASKTRELVSVALHNFQTHETIPLAPELEGGKIVLKFETNGRDTG